MVNFRNFLDALLDQIGVPFRRSFSRFFIFLIVFTKGIIQKRTQNQKNDDSGGSQKAPQKVTLDVFAVVMGDLPKELKIDVS